MPTPHGPRASVLGLDDDVQERSARRLRIGRLEPEENAVAHAEPEAVAGLFFGDRPGESPGLRLQRGEDLDLRVGELAEHPRPRRHHMSA